MQNKMKKFLFVKIISLMQINIAYAEFAGEVMGKVKGEDFIKAFVNQCIHTVGQINRVEALARLLKLKEVEGDAKTLFAPKDNSPNYKAWWVWKDIGAPYVLAINSAEFRETDYSVCSLSNPFINVSTTVQALKDQTPLGEKLEDKSQFGQRHRFWTASKIATGTFISVTDSEQSAAGGVTLSLMSPTN